jgi:CxxC motif-containing protein (DUF1111 family)
MNRSRFQQIRTRVGYWLIGLTGLSALWFLTPGLPVMFAPRASAEVKLVGLSLFRHEWQPHDPLVDQKGDGLGPVFNARSCVECHSQGGVGGGGDNTHNVLAFEALPTQDRPEVKGGLIHRFAVENHFLEGGASIREFFPIVPNGLRIEGGCQVFLRDFDPVHTQSVNSTALFGAGWIDRISGKSIQHQGMRVATARIGQELNGDFSGAVPGRVRILPGGRVGKFGWKAQFATLEEFVAAACANELGLGNPRMEQAKPMVKWSYPKVERDLSEGQFRALVSFVDTLPRPIESSPASPTECDEARQGKALFTKVGCAVCHTPDVGGVAGVYSDFMLHRLDDRDKGGYTETPPVPLPEELPLPAEWKTPALWGVADSAPYLHDGSCATLEAAILRHHGDASAVTDAYRALPANERAAVVRFLKTLRAPSDAEPVSPAPAPRSIAMNR